MIKGKSNPVIRFISGNKWGILFVNIIVFTLLAWLLPIRFEENDDLWMCLIANGSYTGIPDGRLVNIHPILGWGIAGLYRMTKAIEWYTLILAAIQILSVSGIVYALSKNRTMPRILKGLFILFLYVIWARMIVGFQYTTTASLLCLFGCIAILIPRPKWCICGILSIFIASLIRFEAAGMTGILMAPVIVHTLIRRPRVLIPLAGMLLTVLVGFSTEKLFYKDKEWSDYRFYNAVRERINDNPNIDLAYSVLPDHIHPDDYLLFCLFEGDPDILSIEDILPIKKYCMSHLPKRQLLSNLSRLSYYRIPMALLFLGLLLCLFFSLRSRSAGRFITSSYYLSLILLPLVIIMGISAVATLKNRVFISLLLPVTYQALFPVGHFKRDRQAFLTIVLAVMLAGLSVKYSYQDFKVSRISATHAKEFFSKQQPLLDRHTDSIIYPYELNLQAYPPFGIKDIHSHFVTLGWFTGIPFNKGVLKNHQDFVDSDILYFGSVKSSPDLLRGRIKANYGIDVKLQMVDRNERYALYSFQSDRP